VEAGLIYILIEPRILNEAGCRVTFKLFYGMKTFFVKEKTFKYVILVIKEGF